MFCVCVAVCVCIATEASVLALVTSLLTVWGLRIATEADSRAEEGGRQAVYLF